MFVNMAIHYPKPEKEALLIEAMHRLGKALQNQAGLHYINAHKDAQRGVVVAISIWDTKELMLAAGPIIMRITKDVPFDDWEAQPREIYQLTVV
jgi:hypothetical protein